MQKTVVTNICDDCGKEVVHFALQYDGKDLCSKCVHRRVSFSVSHLPIGAKCPNCQGKGYTKDPDGYNGLTKEDCDPCMGTGQAQFRR